MVSYKTNVSLLGILIHTNIIKHLYSSLSLGNFIFFFKFLKAVTQTLYSPFLLFAHREIR